MPRTLTEAEIEESIRFADGALAAAGHFITDAQSDFDTRAFLRGDMTFEELHERALKRVLSE